MKKYFHIINLVLLTVIIFSFTSCKNFDTIKGNGKIIKKEFQIGDFNKFEIDGVYYLVIKQGDVAKLEIETDENLMEYIEPKVKNNKLNIKNKKSLSSSKGITVYLTYNKLEQIIASGYVSLSSTDKLNFDMLEIETSGKTSMNMEINCFDLKAKFSGNSSIDLSGVISTSDMEVSGSAYMNASELIIDNLKMEISGNAIAKVNVVSKFDINVSGTANVEYQGEPEMKQKLSGLGSVTKNL